ncbi:MAG: patatin-like phospholipase family protein [Prosthecobacter sp.]
MSSTIKPIGLDSGNTAWQVQTKDAEKLGNLKSLFVSNKRSSEEIKMSEGSFKEAYMSQVEHVAQQLPKGAVGPFLKKAYDAMDRIVARTFDRTDHQVNQNGGKHTKKVHREMVKTANKLAVESFKSIEKELLKDENVLEQSRTETHKSGVREVPLRPKVLIRNGDICLQRRQPMVETLVLRGGGAKGIANIPAMAELETSGSLKGVKHVVGTSAGALTAMTMACGYDSKLLTKLMEEHPMKGLAGKVEGFGKIYPMVKLVGVAGRFGLRGFLVRHFGGGPGQEALRVADMASAKRVSSFLKENWNTESFQNKLVELKNKHGDEGEALVMRLARLKQEPDFESDRTGKMVTFKDLKILNELAPETFKELTLTGYDKTNQTTTYFNAEKYPDMPVAVAGRISMSIPVAFQTVKFDPGDNKGERSWVDGGSGSNMPSEVVMKDRQGKDLEGTDKEMMHAKTMLFTYAEDGKWEKKLHAPQNQQPDNGIKAKIKTFFSGNPHFQQVGVEDSRKIHEGGLNTFVVYHHDIGTMDLGATKEEMQLAQAQSTLMSLKHIELRQEQMFEQSFEDLEASLPYLSQEEMRAIVDGGPPHPGDFPGGVDNVEYALELQLYKLVTTNLGEEPQEVPLERVNVGGGGIRGDYNLYFEDDPPPQQGGNNTLRTSSEGVHKWDEVM